MKFVKPQNMVNQLSEISKISKHGKSATNYV